MTTQHQIIAMCIIVFIAVPLGTFTTIKCIKKLTRVPENTLIRSGDIELVDFIEPTRPQQTYDLLGQHFPIYDRFQSYPPSYETGVIPSYRSGTLPTYQSIEGININCCLENNINLEIILLVFIFLCFLILWRIRNNPWFNNFIERFLLIHQVEIRILWIVLAVFIMNSLIFNNSLYSISILIPFSFYDINFRDSFDWKFNSYGVKPKISYHNLQTLTNDINLLLLSLEDDVNYSMSLSFIPNYKEWKENKEGIHPLFINDENMS